jgi:hypothetical protein
MEMLATKKSVFAWLRESYIVLGVQLVGISTPFGNLFPD